VPQPPAVEQIGHSHRVTGRTQLVGECDDPGGEPLDVVEQQDFGHCH